MEKYIALLRGINVGGKNVIKMVDLRDAFVSLGFSHIKTLLASGNIHFETSASRECLEKNIAAKLEEEFGYQGSVILRTSADLELLVRLDPFKEIALSEQTRLYTTFIPREFHKKSDLSYISKRGDIQIRSVTPTELCSVITLSKQTGTVDLMKILDEKLGKTVSTRNWNTVLKLVSQ